jgi:hypothetical protein
MSAESCIELETINVNCGYVYIVSLKKRNVMSDVMFEISLIHVFEGIKILIQHYKFPFNNSV